MATHDRRDGQDAAFIGSGPVVVFHLKRSNDDTLVSREDVEKGQVPGDAGHNVRDDPFGDETNSEVKYRTMHWW